MERTRQLGGLKGWTLWCVTIIALGVALCAPAQAIAPADVFTNVPEADDYLLVYELDIPGEDVNYNSDPVEYSVNNSTTITQPFDRIAYYLELQDDSGTHWVYASMDAFTDDLNKIGVPNVAAGAFFQRPVFNMNVHSNDPGIVTGTGINTGMIEFWPSNYKETNDTFVPNASETLYDWGDGSGNITAGYGSMQVHNYDLDGTGPGTIGQTLFAYNRWGIVDGSDDLGIGTATSGGPDWTYTGTAGVYTARKLQVLVRPSPVRFAAMPTFRQLYPRDRATNKATVSVAGTVVTMGYDAAILRVYREGVLAQTLTQTLTYSDRSAKFSFAPQITAEMANYDIELSLIAGGTEQYVRRGREIVSGDVFLINGQSNAVAWQVGGTANGDVSRFIRTFGTSDIDPTGAATVANRLWYIANGDTSFYTYSTGGAVGQWGLRLGRRLLDATGIPLAILNGAHGGQPITFFQRNDANPGDLTTNYGRLLHRVQVAGLQSAVRAVLYHQGEWDNGRAALHESEFTALHDDWLTDYPSTERTYNHQVRDGCGSPTIELRDVQRRLQDTLINVTTMSTTGLDGHDGCHFYYAEGYQLMGDHLADIMLRDFYGAPDTGNIVPPNVNVAYWGNADKTEAVIIMRNTSDGLIWDAGAENDFQLEETSVAVVGASVAGNSLRLALASNGSTATGITYDSHPQAGPWVTNLRGVGLLEFYNVPVSVAPAAQMPQAHVALEAAGLALTWAPAPPNCFYEIHRDPTPYFDPNTATLLAPALPSGAASFTDAASALGNPATNHFYLVRAINCDSTSGAQSNRVGEFDFALR